jgi:ABC-2 type transport system permease protein
MNAIHPSRRAQFLGICTYEFWMQVRRPSLWVFFGLMTIYAYFVVGGGTRFYPNLKLELTTHSLAFTIADIVGNGELLLPLCVGCLLADRLVRDRRVKVAELFQTMDVSLQIRLWGKYFGTLIATALPLFLVLSLFMLYIYIASQSLLVIPLFLGIFLIIALPGLLFVAAFSLACPMVMPVPFYQFLFAGYWLWGNLFLKQKVLPTPSRTILTPSGSLIANGFFGTNTELLGTTPVFAAIASMIVLVVIAIGTMIILERFLKWQQFH